LYAAKLAVVDDTAGYVCGISNEAKMRMLVLVTGFRGHRVKNGERYQKIRLPRRW
jgi:hypothetical protein